VNIFLIWLITLCLYIPLSHADSPNTDVVTAINTGNTELQIVAEHIANQSSRNPGSNYVARDTKTPWVDDFFDFFKYYQLRNDEKEAYLFYMTAPSQPYFTSIFSTARKNYMFLKPFSFYDGYSGLSKSVEQNYLYIYKLDSYDEFLKPSLLDPSNLTTTIDPSVISGASGVFLPRSGKQFNTGENVFDELIRTSAIQDMVFKQFYLYCPEGYDAAGICQAVMDATNVSNAFSTSGAGATSPNAGINPESLLAQPSFAIDSTEHHRSRDYIRMISNPYPRSLVPFKADIANPLAYVADTSDIKQIAKNLTDTAYRGLSAHVLNEIKNRRIQSVDPSETTGLTTTGGTLSQFEFIHSLATDRMLTSNSWLAQINVTSTEGLVRELVIIQASSLMLQYQTFRQNEHIEALLAAMVAQNQNLLEALNFAPDTSKIQDSIAAVG